MTWCSSCQTSAQDPNLKDNQLENTAEEETQWMNTDPESEQGDIFLVLNKLSFSECWIKMIITIAIF
ncbi:hypothetical protein CesoFtcFv8_012487 [Champsocephalus esox]|uniref:Uncharacterized protein n=1 Tax=Champsocephalus esox TaxID=159716 RepID=A0AAN8BUE3_9TELE|nr:hypothetical protein CesoFtcFv8_012487 [Champsocephalus esox]